MIIETAILSLAAIIIASLVTANAIHKRMIAHELEQDPLAEQKRLLRERRLYCIERRHSNDGEGETLRIARDRWETRIAEIDAELLKLARGEFQVPPPADAARTDGEAQEPKGTNPWPKGQRGP